jgi:FixJ family two-component response regulator
VNNSINETPTVYVIDDDPAARDAAAALVDSMQVPVLAFDCAEAFLRDCDAAAAGCIVSDVRMGRLSGLEMIEQLRSAGCFLPVVLLTAYADVPLAVKAMRLGAFTMLEKPCRSQDLWEAIKAGLDLDAEERVRRNALRDKADRLQTLSAEDRRIVDMILQGAPNKSIAAALDLGLRTVEAKRRAIYQKLGIDSLIELTRLVVETGGVGG